jgi:hypothetical protein
MDDFADQVDRNALRGVPFDKQWAILQPVLRRLFVDEKRKYAYIQRWMKDNYGFNAL